MAALLYFDKNAAHKNAIITNHKVFEKKICYYVTVRANAIFTTFKNLR